jgi:hypothetical protein
MTKASDIPIHERTPEQRAQASAEAIAEASPTPAEVAARARAQNLANEKAYQAVENFMRLEEAGQDRYDPTMENETRLYSIIKQLHGGVYSEANLAASLDYAIQHNIIQAKQSEPKDTTPKTLADWAKHLGYTTQKIRDTPSARLRELLRGPHKEVIEYVLANRL